MCGCKVASSPGIQEGQSKTFGSGVIGGGSVVVLVVVVVGALIVSG